MVITGDTAPPWTDRSESKDGRAAQTLIPIQTGLVRALAGKKHCKPGARFEVARPPSGPRLKVWCLGRDIRAKYWGKLFVIIWIFCSSFLLILTLLILELRNWFSELSGLMFVCKLHFFPESHLNITTSRSADSWVEWFISTRTGERKDAGVSCRIRVAKPSPSLRGGGWRTDSTLSWRHVTLTGCSAALGGIAILSPVLRLPVIDPPRASTKKLTRNSALVGLFSPSPPPPPPLSKLSDLLVIPPDAPISHSLFLTHPGDKLFYNIIQLIV